MDECSLSAGSYSTWPLFVPKRQEPEFQPVVAPPAFVLALADRIFAAHSVLARLAEKRAVVLTEVDYPLE